MDKIEIIDSHTHIQDDEFNMDIDDVVNNALDNRIGMIVAGTNVNTTQKGIEIADSHKFIWATAGIHPHEASYISSLDMLKINELSKKHIIVGIGECGLDYSLTPKISEKQKQKQLLIEHIRISKETQKPLVLHCRNSSNHSEDAFLDILSIIKEFISIKRKDAGACHFFTGSKSIAKHFLELGFSFTFGGLITKTSEFDDVIRYIPKQNILLETDAPFVSPKKYKNTRNEPSFIVETVNSLAQILNISIEKTKEITKNNTIRIFNLNQDESR